MNSEQISRMRKELQGPRPAPLRIRKDSHKIRKPSQHRSQPVIIYMQSPKIIHIEAHNFMNLVQHLTGKNSSSVDDNITIADDNHFLSKSQVYDQDDLNHNEAMESAHESGISEKREITEGKLDHPVKGFPPFSPTLNLFSPSSLLMMSPSIFQELPLFTPVYSLGQFYRLPEPIFTPPHGD